MSKIDKKSEFKLLLENKFILTKQMNSKYSEITFGIYHSKWRRNTLIGSIAAFVSAFLILYLLKMIIPFLLLILLGFYIFFMSWKGYKYGSYISYRNMATMYGEPVEMHIEFYKNFFRLKTGKGDRDFLYSQISRRIELKEMSILIVGTKGIIEHGQIVDKRAFTPDELAHYYDILDKAGVTIS